MSVDAYYASGRIAVLSLKLWTKDRFLRLAECPDVPSAMRMLAESGYTAAEGSSDTDFEQVLKRALSEEVAFFNELSPDRNATDCFLLVYDYTNAKNMMKCKYQRTEPQNLFECGLYDPAEMWQGIAVDDYRAFSEEMQSALNEIDRQFVEGNRAPSVIDKLLDKAYFAEIARRNKSVMLPAVKNYWKISTDIANVFMLVRCNRAHIEVNENDFAVGGNIKKNVWKRLVGADYAQIRQAFFETDLHGIADEVCNAAENGQSLTEAAHKAEDIKRRTLTSGKDNFTAEPVICYFLSKTTEIDNIRTVMICIKNNISKQYLKQAVKELYV